MSYQIGEHFWVPDEEHAWLFGTLTEFKNSVLEFSTPKGVKKLRVNDLKAKLEHCGSHVNDQVENLVDLDELSEGAILHHIRNRFAKKLIYTHVGSILVAVNPFENLSIYGDRDVRKAFEATNPYPHVFVTAAVAYQQLRSNEKNQSVLISGESGGTALPLPTPSLDDIIILLTTFLDLTICSWKDGDDEEGTRVSGERGARQQTEGCGRARYGNKDSTVESSARSPRKCKDIA
jgi:hypothetical protein